MAPWKSELAESVRVSYDEVAQGHFREWAENLEALHPTRWLNHPCRLLEVLPSVHEVGPGKYRTRILPGQKNVE